MSHEQIFYLSCLREIQNLIKCNSLNFDRKEFFNFKQTREMKLLKGQCIIDVFSGHVLYEKRAVADSL